MFTYRKETIPGIPSVGVDGYNVYADDRLLGCVRKDGRPCGLPQPRRWIAFSCYRSTSNTSHPEYFPTRKAAAQHLLDIANSKNPC